MAQQQKLGTAHTSTRTREGVTYVQYHATDVVEFTDKYIKLNTGGYFSATTKTRMNQASNQFELGFKVYAINREWFVDVKGKTLRFGSQTLQFQR